MKRKKVIGFNAYDNEQEPQETEESKVDYVRMVLDAYLDGSEPSDDQYESNVAFFSSKDIQDNIKDIVFASVSTITEYMVEHGYKMKQVEGGRRETVLYFNSLPFLYIFAVF